MTEPHVAPEALIEASGPSRRAMLRHLHGCAACRARAAAHDPSLLFGLLSMAPVPEEALAEVSAEVARGIDHDRSSIGTLLAELPWTRRVAVAAAVALMVVSGIVTQRERPVDPAAVSQTHPRADVDVMEGRGVSQVIDLTVGETQIVMVYNGDLNL